MDVKSLSCGEKTRAALASLWAPAGALVIDEAPQGAAALYHALALRSTYGRAAAHRLDIAEYAEPATTFGAMPVVIDCGNELQLPPVSSTAGLFADLADASTVHRAGVDIFRQKDYVYRLATMTRFTDPTLVAVLTKMRKTGGCKLTKEEWAAMQATDISKLPAAEQQRRLQGTDLWYQSAFTWAIEKPAALASAHTSATVNPAPLSSLAE